MDAVCDSAFFLHKISTVAVWMSTGLLAMSMVGSALAREIDAIKLPPPEMAGGKPLMQALKERHSTREFATKPLPPQILSNLMWAAVGVNRPNSGKRTAPSARDWREIDVYVVLQDGAYRYDSQAHTLSSWWAGISASSLACRTSWQRLR